MIRAHRFVNRLTAGLAFAVAALVLAGCAGTSALDELGTTVPTGSAFTQALFHDYAYLANSFGAGGDVGMFDDDTSSLAEAFATKALIAARGTEPDPEPSIDGDSAQARSRLIRALGMNKNRFPNEAARAQTEYDCWMLNSTIASQAGAAAQCHDAFGQAIDRLEHPQFASAPVTAAPPPSADYTVYFAFDSWSLSAEDLTVITNAMAAARSGQQTHITIVGHTDTSGSPGYNQNLSVRRANVVKDVMVQMGARPEAIQTTGVGESDLAVQTPDGVKEPKNRRTVITLQP
jgi:OOP family OmpA-OmpF porin